VLPTSQAQENVSSKKRQTDDFLVQKCITCNKNVERVAGDIIFGDKGIIIHVGAKENNVLPKLEITVLKSDFKKVKS